jgi:hypothetical protein
MSNRPILIGARFSCMYIALSSLSVSEPHCHTNCEYVACKVRRESMLSCNIHARVLTGACKSCFTSISVEVLSHTPVSLAENPACRPFNPGNQTTGSYSISSPQPPWPLSALVADNVMVPARKIAAILPLSRCQSSSSSWIMARLHRRRYEISLLPTHDLDTFKTYLSIQRYLNPTAAVNLTAS